MLKYIIIGVVVLIVLICLLLFLTSKKKLRLIMLNIDEATSNISVLLKKKLELLKTLTDLVKSKIDITDLNIDFEALDSENDNFKLNDSLKNLHNDLFKAIDMNTKVNKNKKGIECLNELNDNEIDLFGVLHFYNDSVVTYNHLVMSFPSNIAAWLLKFKKLEFFKDEKREIFEILKK